MFWQNWNCPWFRAPIEAIEKKQIEKAFSAAQIFAVATDFELMRERPGEPSGGGAE
jgi:hypothetical protein